MLFLLYRVNPQDRNSSGIHSVLVEAADEPSARAAAKAQRPTGETRVRDTWAAINLGAGTLPPGKTVLFFEGDCISMRGMSRGGNPVS